MQTENKKVPRAVPFINVTPLIDVLLVLLIIFMVITPRIGRRFETRTPSPPDQPETQAENYTLLVAVNREGGYQVNFQPIATLDEVKGRVREILSARPSELKQVFIKAPKALAYSEVVRVIDVVKSAGAAPIGLQLENLN
jgi:biopolymer transport protein ExbD